MKRIVLITPFLLLAACGNSGNAALSRTFNYGALTAPTSTETTAGNSAQSSVSTTASFSGTPSAENGAAIASVALDLAGAALGDSAFGMASPQQVKGALIRAATAGFDTCATVSGNTVTFKNCVQTETGFSVSLNGSITASAGHVSWGISAGFSATQNGESVNISMNHAGDVIVTDTKITGHAGSEFSGNVSTQGQSASFGFAVAVLFDLTYQTAPQACVTSGSIEVRRVWTAKPQGASGAAFSDLGVKLVWSGCGAFQVAHST